MQGLWALQSNMAGFGWLSDLRDLTFLNLSSHIITGFNNNNYRVRL